MSNKFLKVVFAGVLALGFTNVALAKSCCNQEDDEVVVRHKHTAHHHHHHHGYGHRHNYMHKDVVISSNGNVVRDSNGGCVRTRYDVGVNKCCHTKHSDIMHMDERIIYFDFNQSALRDGEKAKLDVLANAIRANDIHAVKVVGYTDRIGNSGYNHKLSHQRADRVRQYLGSKVRLQSNVVSLRGLGESHQVKACNGIRDRGELINCLAPNRRVEVEVDYTVHRRSKKY